MVLFSSKKTAGLILIGVTFFEPKAGITGLLGVVFTNLMATSLGVYRERIRKGLYGFNGLLVGLSITLYHELDINLIVLLLIACILMVFVTLGLETAMGYFLGLPVLSLPFVIVTFIVYMAFFNYNAIPLKKTADTIVNSGDVSYLPLALVYYFKALGSIFFQTSTYAGMIVATILFAVSRISFLLSIIGFVFGSGFHILLGGNFNDISSGVVGFNYILSSIAIGGIFLVPSGYSFYLSGLAAITSALVASFTKVFFYFFNFPVLSLPFTLVTLIILYVAKNLGNEKFRVMDYITGSPEENLDYYNTRLKRFGVTGLYIRLPFLGEWIVSQGYNGKYTHRDLWSKSLDFMAIDSDGKLRKGESNKPEDYYTFGLPVLAVGSGRVIKLVSHMEDNEISEIRTEHGENWGNFVIIEHSPYFYSQVSHLKKDSILVKEGDYIAIGARIGLAGNSGRSPEPHIHLHFQRTPELGSPTTEVTLTQYIEHNQEGNSSIKFNKIPSENTVLSNLIPDLTVKGFFSLAPGNKYPIELTDRNGKKSNEVWESKVDFLGHRFLEDENGNLLYFFLGTDFYSSLDYYGDTKSPLYAYYLATYRVPFLMEKSKWEEAITYKHSSTWLKKLAKDTIAPFSEKVSLKWMGEIDETGSLKASLIKGEGGSIFQTKLSFEKSFPGRVEVIDTKGNEWSFQKYEKI